MLYTNHQKTYFFPTSNDIGQSLVNDFWTIINRWQNAADNGYGFAPWMGQATGVTLQLFDWFCASVLKNLVAISVFVILMAIELTKQVWFRQAVAIAIDVTVDAAVELYRWSKPEPWVAPVVTELDAVALIEWASIRFGGLKATDANQGELIAWAYALK